MKVVIVGYGRMGKMIEGILSERGHSVVTRVDNMGCGDTEALRAEILDEADGVIEFALSGGILERIELYAASGLPVVVGTTGWDEQVKQAKKYYKDGKAALLKGSNFSLGAHLFFRLSATAAKMINNAAEYDPSLIEYHHSAKADYPSGTAISAAEGILEQLKRKSHIVTELPQGPIAKDALQVASVRVGAVPGIHEMRMDSLADFITIRHEARGRSGFALGAVRGLEWLQGRSGWHEADEFIDDLLKEK